MSRELLLLVVVFIILVALVFDYINGFHDAANSIATVVSTRVLTPMQAVVVGRLLQLRGRLRLRGPGRAGPSARAWWTSGVVDQWVILGGLCGAIVWNLITWYYGIPSSSSHALIGGFAGAAVAKAGFGALLPSGLLKILAFIVLAPVLGLGLGFTLMVAHALGRAARSARAGWTGSSAGSSSSPPPATAWAMAPTTRRRRWASSPSSSSPPAISAPSSTSPSG